MKRLTLAIAAMVAATPALADYQLRTERARVICGDEVSQAYCQNIANRIDPLLEQAETLLNHQVDHLNIVVGDVSDDANGTAQVLPSNIVHLYTSYPREGSLLNLDDWLDSVIFHELIHIVHMSQSSGFAKAIDSIFGRSFFTLPNGLVPRWMSEGIAVWGESSPTTGRATAPYYSGKLRTVVQAGLPDIEDFTVSARVPVVGDQYLIGSAFIRFITEKYGQDAAARWIRANGAKPFAGFVDGAYYDAFGTKITHDWQQFSAWLSQQVEAQLAAIGTPVQGQALATGRIGAPVVGPNGEIWYFQGAVEAPAVFTNGEDEFELPAGTFDIQFRNGTWQALRGRECDGRSSSELIELVDERWRVVSQCDGWVALVPGGNEYHILFDGSEYQLANQQGELIETPERVLSAVQVNDQLVVLTANGANRDIYTGLPGDWQAIGLADFAPIAIAANQDEIYFVSGINGTQNAFRASDQQPVTNVTGGVTDIVATNNGLVLRQMHPEFYQVNSLSNPMPVATMPVPEPVQSSANLQFASSNNNTYETSNYLPTLALRPINWLPTFGGTADKPAYGAGINFADATGDHTASLVGQTDFDNVQVDLAYAWPNWQLATRVGQVAGSTDESTDWRAQLSFSQGHELGLGLMFGYNLAGQVDDDAYRVGAGLGLGKLRYATYGIQPRKGSTIAAFASWGDDTGGRAQSELAWYRQLGGLYYVAGGSVIWDEGQSAELVNSTSIDGATPGLTQIGLSHPGVLDLGTSDIAWQQRNKLYWGSAYQPRGVLGLSPIGYTRFGATAGTLVSGVDQQVAASITTGVYLDWILGYGIIPVRSELASVFGVENAEWSLALNFETAL
ncbi:hypothetical protein [Salinibius halmophilus]|uniref:hypothetical protein n=1 Tax=Salinibius halmophilus TaxID=1853216 RepID=UPI000E66D772|nr:hypothetical protein [Salinibius halmophilus]